MGEPFICKCGQPLADFSETKWREWGNDLPNIFSPLLEWISKDKREETYWLFLPKYCDLELLNEQRATAVDSTKVINIQLDLATIGDFSKQFYERLAMKYNRSAWFGDLSRK
jgi:hypothetical protein